MDGDDYLFMSSSLFTHCCSEYIIYFLILKSYIIFTHVHIICLLEKVEYHDKKNSKNGMLSINPYLIFGFYVILEMIILKVNAFSITCQFFFYISLSKIEKGNQKNCGKIIYFRRFSKNLHMEIQIFGTI